MEKNHITKEELLKKLDDMHGAVSDEWENKCRECIAAVEEGNVQSVLRLLVAILSTK